MAHAFIDSKVVASFINILSLSIPFFSNKEMISLAISTLFSVSNEYLASTSIETLPGIFFKISIPKFTNSFIAIISKVFFEI